MSVPASAPEAPRNSVSVHADILHTGHVRNVFPGAGIRAALANWDAKWSTQRNANWYAEWVAQRSLLWSSARK